MTGYFVQDFINEGGGERIGQGSSVQPPEVDAYPKLLRVLLLGLDDHGTSPFRLVDRVYDTCGQHSFYLGFNNILILMSELIRSLTDRLRVGHQVDLNLTHSVDETLEIFIVAGKNILDFS